MTVLNYRGNEYLQKNKNEATPKRDVQLSYRRSIYIARQAETKKNLEVTLVYRGIKHTK